MSSVSETSTLDVSNASTSDKNSYSFKHPSFNGDATKISWSKSKIYIHVISVDDELRDIIVDGTDFEVDEEGMVADRKKLTTTQKKIYKKHLRARGILVDALPHVEYMKIGDKLTAKAIYKSLCSTYEGN
jgi:hypothetical protein